MATSPAGPIGGIYTVDFGHTVDGAADPVAPFVARGGGSASVMAIPVARGWPARARVLTALTGTPVRHLLYPLAHGVATMPSGDNGYYVVCPAPPGPSLQASLRPWSESELIEQVVKPVAQVLADLQSRGVTHRAIRAANLFQTARSTPVVLGAAWASPPASQQPNWLEPPYSATCLPAGRGDGTIADDVYALGALLLMLTLGANPVDGIPDEVLLCKKLDEGSYAALVGQHRLPGGLAELIRGMLADEPEHRPSPTLLASPAAARARRIAARPIRRAQRAIEIGAQSATTARTLAHALQRAPKEGVAAIRSGAVDNWLRRGLGDATLAVALDEAVRNWESQGGAAEIKADAMLIVHAVSALNPLAPLVWRSLAVWPDGLGAAIDQAAHHAPEQARTLAEIATAHIAEAWAKRRSLGREALASPLDIRDNRTLLAGDRSDGVPLRFLYASNPLAPCESPLVARYWPTRLLDLLLALEAATGSRLPDSQPLIDKHVAACIFARRDERLQADIGRLAGDVPYNDAFKHLELVAMMQAKLSANPLPHLCAWAADAMQSRIQTFRSRSRRTRIAASLATLANAGQLAPIASLLSNEQDHSSDKDGCRDAANRLCEIEQALGELSSAQTLQAEQARRIGLDVASGISAIACLVAIAFAVFA
jgi:hypothetical protein